MKITKKQMDEIIPNENSLRESQKKIGAILIRSFGAKKCMTEIDSNYVKYCLYDYGKISLEKLLVCNRKLMEILDKMSLKEFKEKLNEKNSKNNDND
jgi:hypothetical protein